MTVRRRLGPLLVTLLVVIGVSAVLLALDVDSWRNGLRVGDARYRATPAAATWRASPVLPLNAARHALAIDDDLAIRRAVRLFRLTYAVKDTLDNALDTQGARAVAELALADVARSTDARNAAQASDLLGVLAFNDFSAGGGRDLSQAERAVSAFVNAVRLDPANDSAKFNLEAALRLFEAHGIRPGASSSTGGQGPGRHGAGTGAPGSGY